MIIDGHAHACGEYLTKESIINKLAAANVDGVVLTPGELGSKRTYHIFNTAKNKPLADIVSENNKLTKAVISLTGKAKKIPLGNNAVFELKKQLPDKIKQAYWLLKDNFQNLESDYELMHFDEIKLHQCWDSFDIEDDFFKETAAWAGERDIPVFIHLGDLTQVPKIIEYIKNNPKTKIIIAHLYGMSSFLTKDTSIFENTYFDLSNCNFVSARKTMLAYNKFGSTKLMFGSDTPYGKRALEQTMAQIMMLPIPSSEKENILGKNVLNLLK